MILKEIELENFGIYGGKQKFDLSLAQDEHFNRPIILLRGRNGVGKSTLVEAIRLCLHGSLSLGARVSQREYETHLRNRLHHGKGKTEPASMAAIRLSFEYVRVGQIQEYHVERIWNRHTNSISSSVNIWEGKEPLEISAEEREAFLRELFPVGVIDLFFFDGEKIETLSEAGAESDLLLAETVKTLLGLHLVEQLDRDLDVYLTRQRTARELHIQQMELEVLRSEELELRQQYDNVKTQLTDCRQRLGSQRKAIANQEQDLTSQGGSLAVKRRANEEKLQQLTAVIAAQEQIVFDFCRDLAPFSMAPKLLKATQTRLKHEADYERWVAVQSTLSELKEKFSEAVSTISYWEGIATLPGEDAQLTHLQRINELFSLYDNSPLSESEVVHRVSEETRGRILDWIDTALRITPQLLAASIGQLNLLQDQFRQIKEELEQTPREEILVPLQKNLRRLERELGHIEAEQERLNAEDSRLKYLLERNAGSRRRVSEQIAQIETDDGKLQLAAHTKLLLAEYNEQLVQEKLRRLEAQIAIRFNQLCRKRNFIERITIDPKDYGIALYRHGRPFPRRQLSAGEQQLFAVSTLWALREISGRPLPVVIDTPLSRLDTKHRHSMVEEFFPQVAHQVIIFATDAEIDDQTFRYLQPAISRAYFLTDQPDTGTSQAVVEQVHSHEAVIRLEEIEINA